MLDQHQIKRLLLTTFLLVAATAAFGETVVTFEEAYNADGKKLSDVYDVSVTCDDGTSKDAGTCNGDKKECAKQAASLCSVAKPRDPDTDDRWTRGGSSEPMHEQRPPQRTLDGGVLFETRSGRAESRCGDGQVVRFQGQVVGCAFVLRSADAPLPAECRGQRSLRTSTRRGQALRATCAVCFQPNGSHLLEPLHHGQAHGFSVDQPGPLDDLRCLQWGGGAPSAMRPAVPQGPRGRFEPGSGQR